MGGVCHRLMERDRTKSVRHFLSRLRSELPPWNSILAQEAIEIWARFTIVNAWGQLKWNMVIFRAVCKSRSNSKPAFMISDGGI